MSEETLKLVIQAIIAVVLVLCMTWIVVLPHTDEAATKAALLVVGSAVGFLFGKNT